jgi:hypothetical protein
MSLFDSYDNDSKADDVEKSRLFDTLNEEGRSVHDYLKVLVPVVVAVLVIGGMVVYFTMPGVGDEVRAPQGLEEAVKTYYDDNEKRAVSEVTYFYCKDFYSARVMLEKRPDVTARQFDHGNRRAIAVENPDGSWSITSNPIAPDENADPCSR